MDFNSSVLRDLTESDMIDIYKELIVYQKTGVLSDGLLKETANSLNQSSFKDTFRDEIFKVELYVSMFLAKKYITEHHL